MKRQQGFTLVELLITVMIIGIVASIAIPAYRDYVKTGQQGALVERVNGLRPFIENARIDTGAYPAGTFVSGGINSFAGIGYSVPGDNDGIKMVVEAGACGTLNDCYKITATDKTGMVGVYEGGTFTWQ